MKECKPIKDFTIFLKESSVSLANMGESLVREGINIEGLCGFIKENHFVVHILVKDTDAARNVLLREKFDLKNENEVIVLSKSEKKIVGRAGSIWGIMSSLAFS